MLLDGEHDVRLRGTVEELLDLLQLALREFPERRSHLHLPTGDVDPHRRAPPQESPDLRELDEGIFSSSRYFATVRRAICNPSPSRILTIAASESGRPAASAAMILRILSLTVSDET